MMIGVSSIPASASSTRISPLHAAIGRVALAKLDERNARRNAGIQYLYDQVSEIPGFSVPPMSDHVERVYYRSPFMIYDPDELGGLSADRFTQALQAEGARLGTSTRLRHRGGLHTQPLFVERKHWAFEHPDNAESRGPRAVRPRHAADHGRPTRQSCVAPAAHTTHPGATRPVRRSVPQGGRQCQRVTVGKPRQAISEGEASYARAVGNPGR